MDDNERLAEQFETHRAHLRTVAYGMLGSLSEADDAVQECWFRLSRTGVEGVENLGGWLTMVVARVSLDMLRSRQRREEPIGAHMPEPIVVGMDEDPEEHALMADAVGLALLVVLETLNPVERLAYIMHDMFGVPFEEIAPAIGRTPAAARQLASRARRRVRGATAAPDPDPSRQRQVVDAFFAAARQGNFEALVAVLDPDVVLRADYDRLTHTGLRTGRMEVRGAQQVARRALEFSRFAPFARPVLVNGSVGVVVMPRSQVISVMGFTVRGGKVAEIDVFADPQRLSRLPVAGARQSWPDN